MRCGRETVAGQMGGSRWRARELRRGTARPFYGHGRRVALRQRARKRQVMFEHMPVVATQDVRRDTAARAAPGCPSIGSAIVVDESDVGLAMAKCLVVCPVAGYRTVNRPGFGGDSSVESQAIRLVRSPSSYRASNSAGGLPPQAP
jgi:hypothetical protein